MSPELVAVIAAGLVIGTYAYLEGPALAWLARVVERRRGRRQS